MISRGGVRPHPGRTRLFVLLVAGLLSGSGAVAHPTTFVFTSDVHYGLHRGQFRGAANVDSAIVNAAMVQQINALAGISLPMDGGVAEGRIIGPLDFVVITGDITNRQELYPLKIQSAAESWTQFDQGFIRMLKAKNPQGSPTPLLLVPGNHDVSNAIGATSRLVPEKDATTLVQIFNRMMNPEKLRTTADYDYAHDKIIFSRDFGGVHGVFLTIWPDRAAREWMEADLRSVSPDTPVFIFCHDPPTADPKHFTNPAPGHSLRAEDRFENILGDIYQDGTDADGSTTIEQRELAEFLRRHRNVICYFHGHNNWTEFYSWTGPDADVALSVFRSDSPMKGKVSGKDESKLAFQVVTFDRAEGKLTARECFWNLSATGGDGSYLIGWGQAKTVALTVASPAPVIGAQQRTAPH